MQKKPVRPWRCSALPKPTRSCSRRSASLDAREQAQQIEWAFEDAADEQGIQPWELALQLIAETPEQLQAMRLETHRDVAEALGMEWEEYCQFNEIDPE